jgi:hypothetical protein
LDAVEIGNSEDFMHRFLISLVAVILMPINNTALAQSAFNGHWNVEVVPEKGACRRNHRYQVVIENGRVRDGGKQHVSITGGLQPNGQVRGSIQRNRTRIEVTGNLSGHSGAGRWTTTGRLTCSGQWRAEKRT